MKPLDFDFSTRTRIVYMWPPNKEHIHCTFLYDGPHKDVKIGEIIWHNDTQYIVTAGPDDFCTGEKGLWHAVKVGEVYDFSQYKYDSGLISDLGNICTYVLFGAIGIYSSIELFCKYILPNLQKLIDYVLSNSN